MKLQPCPWCGSANVKVSDNIYAIECKDCDANGPIAETDADAAELWNDGPKFNNTQRKASRAEQLKAKAVELQAKAAAMLSEAEEGEI